VFSVILAYFATLIKNEMIFEETEIKDVWLIKPKVFNDSRGYFMESFKESEFEKYIPGIHFVQDNESCSTKGVLRGLHFQLEPYAQSKLVHVIRGEVLDIAVDIRKGSPTYGKYISVVLSEENKHQLFMPKGFAHGFLVLSEIAIFIYKVDNLYTPSHERSIRYNDPILNINWGVSGEIDFLVSEKDTQAPSFEDAEMNFA
jgi:dTDP-4-dehydrorhamnose 3,5-epimerase